MKSDPQAILSKINTPRHGNEEVDRLARIEETYRSLVEQASDGIVVTDSEGICLDINTAGCEMVGYERHELIGKSVLDYIAPEDLATIPSRIPEIRRGVAFISERRIVRKSGERVPVEIHAKAMTDGRIIGIYRDLRERHSQQSLLRALLSGTAAQTGEEFFRSLVSNLAKALNARCALIGEIVESEPPSIQTHAIWLDERETGARCFRIEGNACEEALRAGQSLIPASAYTAFPSDELIREIRAQTYFSSALRDSAGKNIGLLAIIDDKPLADPDQTLTILTIFAARAGAELERIRSERMVRLSEQKLNEELERLVRERTAQLEAANKELESFAYSVSHDLRAPLRAIHGNAEILREDLQEGPTAENFKSIERITSRAKEMSMLIDSILKLSRIMRAELNREQLDISAIAHEILDGMAAGRTARVSIQPGLLAEGDRTLVTAALGNLIENALKFSSRAENPRIEIGRSKHAFFVRDNGVGFDMQHAEKLFSPFERLHDPAEFEGTGIGLATVQRIVRRHGGEIWAESELGKGATFYFTL